jgi:hypothetical protein
MKKLHVTREHPIVKKLTKIDSGRGEKIRKIKLYHGSYGLSSKYSLIINSYNYKSVMISYTG